MRGEVIGLSRRNQTKISKRNWPEVQIKYDNLTNEIVFEPKLVQRLHEHDYHFNAPIDQYFHDHEVNKLIYETRNEQKRRETIKKLPFKYEERKFEDFYRVLKNEKIRPALEKEQILLAKRESQFKKLCAKVVS